MSENLFDSKQEVYVPSDRKMVEHMYNFSEYNINNKPLGEVICFFEKALKEQPSARIEKTDLRDVNNPGEHFYIFYDVLETDDQMAIRHRKEKEQFDLKQQNLAEKHKSDLLMLETLAKKLGKKIV